MVKSELAAQPSTSLTDTDESIPSLYKIRFDDHVVDITDPESGEKLTIRKRKHRKKKGSTPPEVIKTAETFEIGRNSNELILCGPGDKREIYKRPPEPSQEAADDRKKAGTGVKESEAKKDASTIATAEPGSAESAAPDEPCIRLGDRLLSRDETTSLLAKLAQLKNEPVNAQQRRRYNNFDSSRTSKVSTPTTEAAPPAPAPAPAPAPVQQRRPSGKEGSARGGVAGENKESSARIYRPRPNFNRIDSCRTSRANSPQDSKKTGIPRRRVRLGDHFMTVEEAEDLLQRLLKANANKPAKRAVSRPASKEVVEDPSGKSRAQSDLKKDEQMFYNVKVDNRVVAVPVMEPPKNEDAECNFSHLNSVIKTEDEVNALILSIIVGVVLFIGLCMIVAKRA